MGVEARALAAFLKERLTSDRAAEDWRRLIEGAWDQLLGRPMSSFLGEELDAFVAAHLTEERAADVVRPAIRLVLRGIVLEARQDGEPVGRWVPDEAREKLMALASKKGVIDPRWIEHLFAQRAMEEVVTDTLYRALRDFSTIVPRIVQSLTPAALGKLAKLGGRATGGVGGRIVDEIERRLEPEIRKFLDKGGRRALDGAARFTIDHLDDPISVEARKNTILFALDQAPAFHVEQLDDSMLETIDAVAEAIAKKAASLDDSKRIAGSVLERIRLEHGEEPLSVWLEAAGVTQRPAFDEWAALTWPYVKLMLTSPETEAFIDALAAEAVETLS